MDFFYLLFSVVAIGGFLGEAYRVPTNEKMLYGRFLINVASGCFLAFLAGWAFYEYRQQRNASLIISGFISFQDVDSVFKLFKKILSKNIKLLHNILEDEEDK